MKQTILITGGAGFIGSNFIFYYRKNHPQSRIVCIDNLTYAGNFKTIQPFYDNDKNFSFITTDIANNSMIQLIFQKEKPDIVINFAAESHVDRSIINPLIFLQTNVFGVGVLLQACRKYNVNRFHQVSTDEVYGDLPLNRLDLSFTEQTPLHPNSPYSASKAAADLLVQTYYRTYNLPVTISRCSNNYGPYQFPEKLIPLMITKALNNEPLPVYGNGLNVRDWIHVQDHCCAIDNIIHYGMQGQVYNIGGNNEESNINIVKLICEIMNVSQNLITYVQDRKGHDLRYSIDYTKIKNQLDWIPKKCFEQGLEQTINWYIKNKQWWKQLL